MKKQIIRSIALVLVGVMLLAFSGCGGEASVETTTEPIVETTTTAMMTATTTEATTTVAMTTEITTEETTVETTTETTTEETTTEETTTEETTTAAPEPAISADDIANHTALPLWPEGEIPYFIERARPVQTPAVKPYIVEGSKSCVLIFPGGGYGSLSTNIEGDNVAAAYNAQGVSAFVVHYRCYPYGKEAILADALRAVQFVRYYAEDFGIDENQIAVCGFSAGGHLAMLSCQYTPEENLAGDEIGEVSSAPNACILSYAVTTLEPGTSSGITPTNFLGNKNKEDPELIAKYSYTYNLAAMPDTFIWCGDRDTSVDYKKNSLALADALTAIGTNVEYTCYSGIGHGVGLASDNTNASKWLANSVKFITDAFAE